MSTHVGPQSKAADLMHAMKYRGEGEDFREAMNRIANALKDNDKHYHEFREILLDQRFMPAGCIQAAMGSMKRITPYNCFVSGTISDSLVEGTGNIFERLKEAATTLRLRGGIGYDFSTLRPKRSLVYGLGGDAQASGPVDFMQVFNATGKVLSTSGNRRGGQMGILRVDHPDIETFVRAKQTEGALEHFNISVAVTDEFMNAVLDGTGFDLRFGGHVHRTIDAQALWEMIMRSTWDYAEPGVLFIDTVNRINNLWYCETIAATNPCGEQPLPPFGACLLGSVNLVKYLRKDADGNYYFDYDQLRHDIPCIVRAMDNVIDRAIYPLADQRDEAISKRRMGIGLTGLANTIEACGFPYGGSAFVVMQARIQETLLHTAYRASIDLARTKGPFKKFEAEPYCEGEFIKTLPDDIRDMITVHGIRNSHLTSIAPTGTISMCADNVSSGIEPVYKHRIQRPVHTPDGVMTFDVPDYGVEYLRIRGKESHEVEIHEHVAVLTTAQKYIDSAVSKTTNVDGSCPWEKFKQIYFTAWQGGAKGCTTFNKNGKRAALFTDDNTPGEVCYIDPETGRRECS